MDSTQTLGKFYWPMKLYFDKKHVFVELSQSEWSFKSHDQLNLFFNMQFNVNLHFFLVQIFPLLTSIIVI